MKKRGQIPETLLYIAGGIITAIVVYYGASAIIGFQKKGTEADIILLKEKISADVARISNQLGASRNFSYSFPSQFDEICYVDTSKTLEIKENINKIISADSSIKNKNQAIEIINDSISSGSKNNVFLLGPSPDSFIAGRIQVCKKPIKCFQADYGKVSAGLYGGGGFALLDPCEVIKNLPPYIINTTAKNIIIFVDIASPQTFPSIESLALIVDPEGSDMDVSWRIMNPQGEIETLEKGVFKNDSVTDNTLSPLEYGRYKATAIARDASGKQGSLEFSITIAQPGNEPPEANITLPTTLSGYSPGQMIAFEAIGNDTEGGMLSYSWDFGDGSPVSANSPSRAEHQRFTVSQQHTFPASGMYSVTFTVTDAGGLSEASIKQIIVGNTLPEITIISPKNNEIVPVEDVNFTFIPVDTEQDLMDCLISLINQTGGLKRITVGPVANFTNASLIETLPEGNYTWTASCSDGIGTGTSATMRFEVKLSIPQLICSVTDSCAFTPIFSLSAPGNAHGAIATDYYPQQVCCRLTNGATIAPDTTCSDQRMISRLSGPLNAHAEIAEKSSYPSPICLSSASTGFSCRSTAGNCDQQGETCVVALSADTNAHLESCDSGNYPFKVCCKTVPLNS